MPFLFIVQLVTVKSKDLYSTLWSETTSFHNRNVLDTLKTARCPNRFILL